MGEFGIGQPVPREEDPYLVRGDGRYVDDVSVVNQARAYVLRSQYSHAKIVSIDVKRARQSPGVLHILTGNDPAVLALGLQAPKQPRKRRDGSPQFVTPQPLLARDRVRYIGQPVAMVIAETLNEAKDAAELIEVEYEDLPSATTLEEAIAPDAPAGVGGVPRQHRVLPRGRQQSGGRRSHRQGRPRHQTPYADQPSHHGVDGAARLSRRIRSCATSATRSAARCRDRIRCGALWRRTSSRFRSTRIRVISDNVGGGFGMKGGVYPEYQLAMLAAKLTGRPVKWIADRSESFLADEHCRDNITEAELALDKNGKFLAIRVKNYCNIGAYNASDRAGGPPTNNIGVLAGTYTFPAGYVEVNGTFTNTMLTGPYRGAGRPEAAYVLETLVDLAARKLGVDPAELRAQEHDPEGGDAVQDRAGLHLRLRRLRQEPRRLPRAWRTTKASRSACGNRAKHGKLRGLGIASTVEASNAGLIEHSELRFDQSGALTVSMGTHDHGQGHGTAFRQIIADKLGIPPDRVRFQFGDTDQIAIGTGTFGSRSMACGGTALLDRRREGHRQGQEARGAHARSRRARHRVREGQVHGRRHRQDHRPRRSRQALVQPQGAAARHGSRHVRERHLRRRRAHLSERLPYRRGRDRRGRPARSRSCAITRSTTSAT